MGQLEIFMAYIGDRTCECQMIPRKSVIFMRNAYVNLLYKLGTLAFS